MNVIQFVNHEYKEGISVVIPFYGNVNWLAEAIRSVERQTRLPDEVIVIDDGSPEKPDAVSSKILELRIIHQSNVGAAGARNAGISLVGYRYIAFLDSDDYWYPEKLEYQYRIMNVTGAKWSFHTYDRFTAHPGKATVKTRLRYEVSRVYPAITDSCRIGTPCVMVDRSVFEENCFRFNEAMKYGEDVCLWFLLANSYPAAVIHDSLCGVRIHDDNAANQVSIQMKARRELYDFIRENHLPLNPSTRIAYRMSCAAVGLVNFLIKSPSGIMREAASCAAFFPAWFLFKLFGRAHKYKILSQGTVDYESSEYLSYRTLQ